MSEPRIYHYLGKRQLRDWLHVEIEDRDESKYVTFVSRFHVGKRFPNSFSYSGKFTDEEILRDGALAQRCEGMFGPDWYVGSIRI
jgi:hypothetical protein